MTLRSKSKPSIASTARSIATALLNRQESFAFATKRQVRTTCNPTLAKAKLQDDWSEWFTAIQRELQMLKELGCYDQVRRHEVQIDPKTSRPYQVIPTKMDLKLKFDSMGKATKYKGRLVALGNQE